MNIQTILQALQAIGQGIQAIAQGVTATATTNIQAIVQALQTIGQGVTATAQNIATVFPQQTGTASSATAGSATLPANPVGFIIVTLPSGSTVKVPYYAQ